MPINTFPQVLDLRACPREQSNGFKLVSQIYMANIALVFGKLWVPQTSLLFCVMPAHKSGRILVLFMPFYKPLSQTRCFLSLALNISLKDLWGPCLRSDLGPLMFSSAESHSISPHASAPPRGSDKEQRDCTFLIQGLNQYPCHKQGQAISFRRERSLLCRHTQ